MSVHPDFSNRSLGAIVRLSVAGLVITAVCGATTVALGPAHLTAAIAQSDAPEPASASAPGGGRHLFAKALMSVGLSDAQKTKIRGITTATRAKNQNADPTTRRANWKAAFGQIDTILSADQRTRLHAAIGKMRKEQQPPPGGTAPQS